jgi:LCP family protein required for cell wall assembly
MNNKNFKIAWKKILLATLCATILLLVIVFGTVYWQLFKINISKPVKTVSTDKSGFSSGSPAISGKPDSGTLIIESGVISWPKPEEPVKGKNILNLLLLWQKGGAGEAPRNAEAIVMLCFNSSEKTVKAVSFLPKMYVRASENKVNSLSTAYSYGGLEQLKKTVAENFGVYIDGCFEIDFDGICKMLDNAGGVDIMLSPAEAEAIKKSAGLNHFDGAAALDYTNLYINDAGFEKMLRQRKVMAQFSNKLSVLGREEKLRILNEVLPYLATDMTREDMLSTMYTIIKNGNLRIDSADYSIPASKAYKTVSISGNEIILPDLSANRVLLKKWLYNIDG